MYIIKVIYKAGFQSPISGSQTSQCQPPNQKNLNVSIPYKRVTNEVSIKYKGKDIVFQSPISGSQTFLHEWLLVSLLGFQSPISGSQTRADNDILGYPFISSSLAFIISFSDKYAIYRLVNMFWLVVADWGFSRHWWSTTFLNISTVLFAPAILTELMRKDLQFFGNNTRSSLLSLHSFQFTFYPNDCNTLRCPGER